MDKRYQIILEKFLKDKKSGKKDKVIINPPDNTYGTLLVKANK